MDASSSFSSADNQDVNSESRFDGYFSGGRGAHGDQQVFRSEQDDIEVVQDQQNFDDQGADQQQAFGVPYDNEGMFDAIYIDSSLQTKARIPCPLLVCNILWLLLLITLLD